MLQPRVLTNVLSQVNTDGVISSFLFRQDGILLGHASIDREYDPRIGAAVASNLWSIYDKNGRGSLDEDRLKLVLVECETGRLAVRQVNPQILVCLLAKENVELGVVTAKIDALVEYLEEPLQKIEM